MKRVFLILSLLGALFGARAQEYVNPILHLDYSDPDVCRVGGDYYMTASSFNYFPGLPILHSKDLIHWDLIGAALGNYPGDGTDDFAAEVRHGEGVWAPAIRYHEGWFYIFCGDPDRGIFRVRAKDPAGPWEPPVWVVRQKGFIDPCPFWDDDGTAWLSHGLAGSRAGLKSVLFVAPMDAEGTCLTGPSRIVFDGHLTQPTIEGTKLYKREGKYYLFAPAGGVATGWQTVLRADAVTGPYEEKIVLASAPGTVNGPHQGAWVDTPSGQDWFLHFQDKGAYGRIVHLQPMRWTSDGWPLIGEDPDGDGVGQPVSRHAAPDVYTHVNPYQKQDGLTPSATGPYGLPAEWQYPVVPSPYWHYAFPDGGIRLYSFEQPAAPNLWNCPNLLSQKFPAERFTVTARLTFRPNPQLKEHGEQAGFAVFGNDIFGLRLTDEGEQMRIDGFSAVDAANGKPEETETFGRIPFQFEKQVFPYASTQVPAVSYPDRPIATVWVRLEVKPRAVEGNVPDAVCTLSYSTDGVDYQGARTFQAKPEMWTGARFGFFCLRHTPKNDAGWLDVTDLDIRTEFQSNPGYNYDEARVPAYTLPDLLTTADGRPVKTRKDWETLRRPELLRLFTDEMFGRAPDKPEGLHFKLLQEDPQALDGLATRREVALWLDQAESQRIVLLLYVPNRTKQPVPAFLGINFFGNHTTTDEPGVLLPEYDRYEGLLSRQDRGSQQQRWPLKTILERGYAVATFCCADVDPDADDGFRNGVHGLFDKGRNDHSWGSLAAWAWGLSRALDYLETDPAVDGKRVAVFGHSRMGKAAVWAGASDPRFAMVISNASGCGGAALSRRRFGETVARINDHFPHWFCGAFQAYDDAEERLPFDQHELLALVAPRPLYVESGSADLWSDPYGEYLSLTEAGKVYELYGYERFTDIVPPAVEQPQVRGRNGYHVRDGRHEILLYDWQQYLNFADRFL